MKKVECGMISRKDAKAAKILLTGSTGFTGWGSLFFTDRKGHKERGIFDRIDRMNGMETREWGYKTITVRSAEPQLRP